MVFFPVLMWYLWVGQVYYNAQLPFPAKGQPFGDFVLDIVDKAMEVSISPRTGVSFGPRP